MAFTFNVLSKTQVALGVSDFVGDLTVDPTTCPVQIAFSSPGVLPTTWTAANWVTNAASAAFAMVLVGPDDGQYPTSDVTLGVGTYVAWVKIFGPNSTPVIQADTVTITGASYSVPVVSVQQMADYMGYPFKPQQINAVQAAIDTVTGQLQRWLNADLSVQQWVENYTVPFDGPTPFLNSYLGSIDYGSMYPDTAYFNMAQTVGLVRLQHWPIVSWDALAVYVTTSAAQLSPTSLPFLPPGSASAVYVSIDPPIYPEQLPAFAPGTQVQVTYTAGWDGQAMADVQAVVKRAAARELTNRLDDAVGLKAFSTVRLPDGGGADATVPGLTMAELSSLSRLKNRIIV